jgi:hypothetical protein
VLGFDLRGLFDIGDGPRHFQDAIAGADAPPKVVVRITT